MYEKCFPRAKEFASLQKQAALKNALRLDKDFCAYCFVLAQARMHSGRLDAQQIAEVRSVITSPDYPL